MTLYRYWKITVAIPSVYNFNILWNMEITEYFRNNSRNSLNPEIDWLESCRIVQIAARSLRPNFIRHLLKIFSASKIYEMQFINHVHNKPNSGEIEMKKEIRTANIDDLERLIHLLNLLFSQDIEFEADYEKQKKGLKEILENPDIGEILVLTIDGNIIAMVSLLYSISTALGGRVAILEDMIIDKDFRSKNYGTELINESIKFAREKNVLRITLLTDYDNDRAINFYGNAGFVKSKMIPMRLIFNGKN